MYLLFPLLRTLFPKCHLLLTSSPPSGLGSNTPCSGRLSLVAQILLDSRALFLPEEKTTARFLGPTPSLRQRRGSQASFWTWGLGSAVEAGSSQVLSCAEASAYLPREVALTCSHGLPGCRWESPTSSSTYLTWADSDPHPWPEGAAAAPPGPLMGNSAARAWLGQTLTHLTPPSLCLWKSHLPLARDAPALCSQGAFPLCTFAQAVPWPAVAFCWEPFCSFPAQPEGCLLPGNIRDCSGLKGKGGSGRANTNILIILLPY